MKKYFFSSLILLIALAQINAQEISTVQNSLVVKKTATWCPKCGDWGWSIFADMVDELQDDNVVFLAAHYSGQLETDAGKAITSNFGVSGQPNYYFNGVDQDVRSTNTSDKGVSIRDQIKDHSSNEANIGIGIEATIDSAKIDASVSIQFLKDLEGEFYLSLYIVEDPLSFYQAGHSDGNDTSHKKILRTHMTDDALADLVVEGPVSSNEMFQLDLSKNLEDDWLKDNLSLTAIVWKKVGDKLEYENASNVEFSLTSPVVDHTSPIKGISSTFVDDNLRVFISSTENGTFTFRLIEAGSGKKILTKQSEIRAGANEFNIFSNKITPGVYILNIENNNRLIQSSKIIKSN